MRAAGIFITDAVHRAHEALTEVLDNTEVTAEDFTALVGAQRALRQRIAKVEGLCGTCMRPLNEDIR